MKIVELSERISEDAQQERAVLATIGFTSAFGACRGITHAIRAGVGPFHNIGTKGGTHVHHSTFGIFGLLGIGFLWAQQVFTGHDDPPRWGSRVTATTYGVAAALTLDEFALWLDLHDDYWDAKGRKSVDAAIIFGGMLSTVVVASQALEELGWLPRLSRFAARFDIRRRVTLKDAPSAGGSAAASTTDAPTATPA